MWVILLEKQRFFFIKTADFPVFQYLIANVIISKQFFDFMNYESIEKIHRRFSKIVNITIEHAQRIPNSSKIDKIELKTEIITS